MTRYFSVARNLLLVGLCSLGINGGAYAATEAAEMGDQSLPPECKRQELQLPQQVRSGLVCRSAHVNSTSNPLVFVFHGHGSSARDMERGIKLQNAWPEAFVVYLDGLKGGAPTPGDPQSLLTGWQLKPGDSADRDVQFTDIALEKLLAQLPIDPKRIYAVGHSNGAFMAAVLWAERPAIFAGFGFSAGGPFPQMVPALSGNKAVFMSSGVQDTVVPFNAQMAVETAIRNRMGLKMPLKPGVTAECSADGCETAYIHAGGHEWPAESTALMIAALRGR